MLRTALSFGQKSLSELIMRLPSHRFQLLEQHDLRLSAAFSCSIFSDFEQQHPLLPDFACSSGFRIGFSTFLGSVLVSFMTFSFINRVNQSFWRSDDIQNLGLLNIGTRLGPWRYTVEKEIWFLPSLN